ncbi:MAG TPA: DEAD/DEAH box helicase family protein [Thermoanaerobaculia bacterium]|jgi:type III restriction enzyme|nr:DEAD/DEAH box helicase family protein [Thermoanaerobaculia bacterium]
MRTDQPIPIQPVEQPILCSPYVEPDQHWIYDVSGVPRKVSGRRVSQYWYKDERTGSAQLSIAGITQERADDLPLVNELREDVKRWRDSGWENASETTKKLLRHWRREDRPRRLFFCQIEAVETIIYLREILAANRKTRWNPKLTLSEYRELAAGRNPRPEEWSPQAMQQPKLLDRSADPSFDPFARYATKMATGSGKTVVMAMLISWAFCNRGTKPRDARYPRRALVVCPNLTIKERLDVLRPGDANNYYERFDLVPSALRPELAKGQVLVTNWHIFNESSETESVGGLPFVQLGPESEEAFAKNRLHDLVDDDEPLIVLNDEGHHAYRPAPVGEDSKLSAEAKADREEAKVWIKGIDKVSAACGVAFCIDLSATPFYIGGSGYPEGSPFPWIVSDFSLVDAIESGITKIPRLPAIDNTGRPDPKYFRLWEHITSDLKSGERLSGGKPKPEVIYRNAQDALLTLASEWKERYEQMEAAVPGQERVPPVMIVVCDNTDIAEEFHRRISGEEMIRIEVEEDDEDDDAPKKKKKLKPQKRYGNGALGLEPLWNRKGVEVTLRIDSNLLAQAESDDPKVNRNEAAQQLRRIVSSVGRPGEPGEKIRCVVSVNMLSEGWDANNVTHILGLRAFGSQLLCEQVVGRGLRRMDYTPDPKTGLLTAEYVDIFGVPFSLIPFKGRQPHEKAPPEDRPKNEVKALPEREHLKISFPIVEGYVADLVRNRIRCDVASVPKIRLDPGTTPNAAFVRPQVGYQVGTISAQGGFGFTEMNRDEYHQSVHPQTIRFVIAREIVRALTETTDPRKESLRRESRATLFPQVLRIVEEFVATRVDLNGQHPTEIGLETYAQKIASLLTTAIVPDERVGEVTILPRLNRYRPIGTTDHVHFKTVKPVQATQASAVSHVAADTTSWEQAAAFQIEKLAIEGVVHSYVRNDHLEFNIPYDSDGSHVYEPDFIVKLTNGLSVVLEVKGFDRPDTSLKTAAAYRWLEAVNHWGGLGRWDYVLVHDPQQVGEQLREFVKIDAVQVTV